jgi:hypothetical protein
VKAALLVLLAAGILLQGCAVMHFRDSRTKGPEGPVQQAWHHNAVFSLMEFTPPLHLDALCPGGWSRITTQDTFLTVLAGLADDAATGFLFPIGIDAWDPQVVRWTCLDAAAADSLVAGAAPSAR